MCFKNPPKIMSFSCLLFHEFPYNTLKTLSSKHIFKIYSINTNFDRKTWKIKHWLCLLQLGILWMYPHHFFCKDLWHPKMSWLHAPTWPRLFPQMLITLCLNNYFNKDQFPLSKQHGMCIVNMGPRRNNSINLVVFHNFFVKIDHKHRELPLPLYKFNVPQHIQVYKVWHK